MDIKYFLKNKIPTVNPEDVNELANFQIIDVRTPEEYVAELGHIKNSQLITLGNELNNFLNSTDKKNEIIFVCRSGMRSGQATQDALKKGFTDVYNMDGGMLKWNELGLPVMH